MLVKDNSRANFFGYEAGARKPTFPQASPEGEIPIDRFKEKVYRDYFCYVNYMFVIW